MITPDSIQVTSYASRHIIEVSLSKPHAHLSNGFPTIYISIPVWNRWTKFAKHFVQLAKRFACELIEKQFATTIIRSSQVETKQNVFVNVRGSAFDFAKACIVTNFSQHRKVRDPQATADKELSEPMMGFSFATLIATSTVYLYLLVYQYSSKVVYGFFMQN